MSHQHEPWRPDYRLDGFEPANDATAADFGAATICDDSFIPVTAHHTGDGRDSYLVFYDTSATWDVPGTPAYVAMHITRDRERHTFRCATQSEPLVPLAQRWLIQRGCPAEAINASPDDAPQPKDNLTQRLEEQLKSSSDRYDVLDHYTHNPGSFDFGTETWAIIHDRHPDSAELPYRVFIEEVSKDFDVYTVREGAFSSCEDADEWLFNRDTPLPEPAASPNPSATAARAQAALTRSTTKSWAAPASITVDSAIRPATEQPQTRKGTR
ncbi:hypothetical protein [Streptomyces silvisoli]|uniref:Uncharacterized protein n=1 Tax=Streptomyces silvisoli TaxID=3034235 RepID=A0ABT5ZQL6_9ACTN|nr:hypothetical protein [Streptomyces silvisoli]MDF3291895.1 hypothetical protein [Streptomyces silvisoli]